MLFHVLGPVLCQLIVHNSYGIIQKRLSQFFNVMGVTKNINWLKEMRQYVGIWYMIWHISFEMMSCKRYWFLNFDTQYDSYDSNIIRRLKIKNVLWLEHVFRFTPNYSIDYGMFIGVKICSVINLSYRNAQKEFLFNWTYLLLFNTCCFTTEPPLGVLFYLLFFVISTYNILYVNREHVRCVKKLQILLRV